MPLKPLDQAIKEGIRRNEIAKIQAYCLYIAIFVAIVTAFALF